ncbi:hypothetical protein PQO03_00875 [Lentisphaera profundi]|uniref:Carboxypeptidase regulatory-like domain-containing protein n=1 Tax=Lentisphaera profundi TaxID=1658616 RepID=A0ABY7VTC4_9BACT|nr:hypothetical protein [Lentisphaera profundi]WDE96518.1 hypothetical protein PQO03_00875 [Lentisphaera profundi]
MDERIVFFYYFMTRKPEDRKKACVIYKNWRQLGDKFFYDISNDRRQEIDKLISVIIIDFEGDIEVDDSLVQAYQGALALEAASATNTTNSRIHFGATNRLFRPGGKLSWDFKMIPPGKYKVEVITTGYKRMAWHEKSAPRDMYNTFKVSEIGEVTITQSGNYTLDLRPLKVINKKRAGLNIRQVRLIPVN